ncbi:MAG: N-acetylmuramoyl-L-alanine amidase [Gammaproteobacteria bacterium]|nr:N-acetylmuramoyl-L-alanine amidase [Gammaproteobacteria bacterium]
MKTYSKIILLFLLIFLGEETLAQTLKITGFRFSIEPNKVRLVFDANGPINYTSVTFRERIVVDIRKTKLAAFLNKPGLSKTPISSILNTQIKNDLRLIINLKTPVNVEHFSLSKPNRLILDLYLQEEKKVAPSPKPPVSAAPVQTPVLPTPASPVPGPASDVSNSKDEGLEQAFKDSMQNVDEKEGGSREILIVIDPGHGGKDPGAVGGNGTREKDVNLAVAKILKNTINNTKGFRAILTRNGDYFITLRKRLAIAHNHRADMFISVHADAYRYRDAHGASVFALSQRGATSEAARWLAEKENESELGQAIFDKNALLRSVLIDLAQTATISASLDIGGRILQKLETVTSLHSRRVEQAAFVVLKSPDIPSLLVEVGFLSYAKEELRLRDSRYQAEIASRLANGVCSYFIKRPPSGTYLAKIKQQLNPRMTALKDSW